MLKSTPVKAITLSFFILLTTAFVIYRGGGFDNYLSSKSQVQTSPNGGNVNPGGIDSLPKKIKDSVDRQRAMMYSSKTMVVTDWKVSLPTTRKLSFADSLRLNGRMDSAKSRPAKAMMSSSKSGYIFTPSPKSASIQDSIIKPIIKIDTLKKR